MKNLNPLQVSHLVRFCKGIPTTSNISGVVGLILESETAPTVQNGEPINYVNLPSSFDIETTQTANGAYMYHWQMSFGWFPENHIEVTGRTWEEWVETMNTLNTLGKIIGEVLVVYVQNLSYEHSFIRHVFPASQIRRKNPCEWDDVFSIGNRHPVRVVCDNIEFRDSSILANNSLAGIGKNLTKYKVEKMVGDLDYTVMRNSKTPLTEKEFGYCINDVLVVIAYIREQMEEWGNIAEIPMTNTGGIRKVMKGIFEGSPEWQRQAMEGAIDGEQYDTLRKTFMGGCVVANPMRLNIKYKNVGSYDLTSSYPTVMVVEKFPSGKPTKRMGRFSLEDLSSYPAWCGLLVAEKLEFNGKDLPISIISEHKIFRETPETQIKIKINGRVYLVEGSVGTFVTNIDMETISRNYNLGNIYIENPVTFDTVEELPKDMRLYILELYKKKTTLKGVEGEEAEYMRSKNRINSVYGMTVTSLIMEEFHTSQGEWVERERDLSRLFASIGRKQKNPSRFLCYQWGVWVTSYARRNLYYGIRSVGDDFVYSDTDSVKFLNPDKHTEPFEEYNRTLQDRFRHLYGDRYEELINPKDIKGEPHPLGNWDFEGVYDEFKTIRSKAYMTRKTKKNKQGKNERVLEITLSGCGKVSASEWFATKKDPFSLFNLHMVIPAEVTKKLTPRYFDTPVTETITDEFGNSEEMTSLSGQILVPTAFEASQDVETAILNGLAQLRKYEQL